jgi:uncharacterized protein with von Willebrand factor type A (vWA) domain
VDGLGPSHSAKRLLGILQANGLTRTGPAAGAVVRARRSETGPALTLSSLALLAVLATEPSGSGVAGKTLASIRDRARKVFGLNPEARSEWNTTNSIMDTYKPICHEVFEARNLRQLAAFVYAIT